MNQRKQAALVGFIGAGIAAGLSTSTMVRMLAGSSRKLTDEEKQARYEEQERQAKLLEIPKQVQARIDRKEAKKSAKKALKKEAKLKKR